MDSQPFEEQGPMSLPEGFMLLNAALHLILIYRLVLYINFHLICYIGRAQKCSRLLMIAGFGSRGRFWLFCGLQIRNAPRTPASSRGTINAVL